MVNSPANQNGTGFDPQPFGYGSKKKEKQGTAGFSAWFHLPGLGNEKWNEPGNWSKGNHRLDGFSQGHSNSLSKKIGRKERTRSFGGQDHPWCKNWNLFGADFEWDSKEIMEMGWSPNRKVELPIKHFRSPLIRFGTGWVCLKSSARSVPCLIVSPKVQS